MVLKLLDPGPVTFLTDNQALVLALANPETSSHSVRQTKESLNKLGARREVTIGWIKAHVGYPGNESADLLAKQGSEMETFGCEPFIPLSYSSVKTKIDKELRKTWATRWRHGKDSRQTRIFLPAAATILRI